NPILSRLKRIGLEPGRTCDFDALPLSVRSAIHDAPKNALPRIMHPPTRARQANGWSLPATPIGTYGTDYVRRAAVAYQGPGAETIDDTVHLPYDESSSKSVLEGASDYVLHFEAAAIPPVHAFWSLSVYNQRQLFVANTLGRHAIGSLDRLSF